MGKPVLSEKQAAWLAAYQSGKDATEAAMIAYQCTSKASARTLGSRMLGRFADLLEADGKRGADADARQAGIDEIRRFWAATMRDDAAELKDRLKASELAARSMGAFVERREIVGAQTITVKLLDDEEMKDTE